MLLETFAITPRFWELLLMALSATALIWYCQYHWRRRHLYHLASKVPGPTGWPIIGCAGHFIGNPTVIYNNIMKIFAAYPDLAGVWYGPTLVYAVSKPEYLETIMNSPKAFSKMYLYKYAVPIVGHGLFTAPVPIWKRHRKIIMPAFNQKILDGFVEVFGEQCTIMADQLQHFLTKGEFDMFHVVTSCTLKIICETAMGIKVNANCDFNEWADRLMEILFLRMFVIWYHFDFIFKWTKLYQDHCQLLDKFHGFTDAIVKEKRVAYEKKMEDQRLGIDDMENEEPIKRKAFLDLLIEMSSGENKLTDKEIGDEVNTFMIAGSDTTATSVGFVFIMLGMHPEIQEKVHSEVMEILGADRVIEAADLPQLKYTEQVVKETLRLFPVGAYVVRDLQDDLPLNDEITLAKGASAMLGIMPVQRNAKYWPDPLKFDPDRFEPKQIARRHPYCYIPFSGGPRNCIGPKYAMMAMKAMVATLIRRYRFSTSYARVEDVALKTNLVLRPRDGLKVAIELRQ